MDTQKGISARVYTVLERLTVAREQLKARLVRGAFSQAAFEFLAFGVKQAWACVFGGALLALLLATHLFYPENAPLARYDFLTLAALALQAGLIASKLETLEEARVIAAFHLVGTLMEIFKTHVGSWSYPEANLLRIGGVPLFSGFMYAAVGSYLVRVQRVFDFRFERFPPLWAQSALALAIYVNFFSHHYVVDIRYGLFAATALIYGRCVVWFRPDAVHRPMPLICRVFLGGEFYLVCGEYRDLRGALGRIPTNRQYGPRWDCQSSAHGIC